jgi:hypothetical protein
MLGALIGLGVVGASVAALRPGPRARAGARSKGERAALSPSLESRHGGEGVSAAEAEALIPAPRARPPLPPPAVPGAAPAAPSAAPATRDVRLEGRIPPGARPLDARLRDATRPAYPAPLAEPRRGEAAPTAPVIPTAPLAAGAGTLTVEVRPVESQGRGPAQPSWERANHVQVEPAEPWQSPALPAETEDVVLRATDAVEPDEAPLVSTVDPEVAPPAVVEEPAAARPARARRAPRGTARAAERTAERDACALPAARLGAGRSVRRARHRDSGGGRRAGPSWFRSRGGGAAGRLRRR